MLESVERARTAPPIAKAEVTGPVKEESSPVRELGEPKTQGSRASVIPRPPSTRAVSRVELYQEAIEPDIWPGDDFYIDANWVAERTIPDQVVSCVQVEGPVHISRVIGAIAGGWGFRRVGSRISPVINRGIRVAERQKKILLRGDFLWEPNMTFDQVPVRRPGVDQKLRPIQEVALEELGRAALFVVEESFSLPLEDLVTETSRLLGYERTGIHVSNRVLDSINLLIQQRRLVDTGGMVTLPVSNHLAE